MNQQEDLKMPEAELSDEVLRTAEPELRKFAWLVVISNTIDNKDTMPDALKAVEEANGDSARGLLLWTQRVIEWNEVENDPTLTALLSIAHEAIDAAREKWRAARMNLAGRIAAAFPGFIRGTDVSGGDLVAWFAETIDEVTQEARENMLTLLRNRFPGFTEAGHDIAGADLVDWVNEELGAELAVIRDSHRLRPQWGTAGPEGARLFFTELEEHVDALDDIANKYGPRTLAALMYLQNAIASGGTIDHYLGECPVLEVLELMPSAERWKQYVDVMQPAEKYKASA